jgi:hypothetical protein
MKVDRCFELLFTAKSLAPDLEQCRAYLLSALSGCLSLSCRDNGYKAVGKSESDIREGT